MRTAQQEEESVVARNTDGSIQLRLDQVKKSKARPGEEKAKGGVSVVHSITNTSEDGGHQALMHASNIHKSVLQ